MERPRPGFRKPIRLITKPCLELARAEAGLHSVREIHRDLDILAARRDLHRACKVVVLTGASSGIGRATARGLAEHGARLTLCIKLASNAFQAAEQAPRTQLLDQTVCECVMLGGKATAVPVDVSVCTVPPGSTDTPRFQHSGNYVGRAMHPRKPITDARRVAEIIVATVKQPRRERFVDIARVLPVIEALVPRQLEILCRKLGEETSIPGRTGTTIIRKRPLLLRSALGLSSVLQAQA